MAGEWKKVDNIDPQKNLLEPLITALREVLKAEQDELELKLRNLLLMGVIEKKEE